MSLQWLQTARHGGRVERCHTVPTIQSYNVGEHSFNAILIAHTICAQLDYKINRVYEDGHQMIDINEDNIAKYILLHDLAEGYTGDIPANVKKETNIKSVMDRIEDEWTKKHVPDYMDATIDCFEYVIAKLADTLELCMFCKDEITMGNRHPSMLHMADRASAYAMNYRDGIGAKDFSPAIVKEIVEDLRGML